MSDLYLFGSFELDAAEHRLTAGGEPVALAGRAFDTLLVLVRNPGRLVTRDELITAVWGETIVEEGNLHWTVSVVRRALAPGGGDAWIETVRGKGYRFLAPVEVLPDKPPVVEERSEEERPASLPGVSRTTLRLWLASAGVAAVLLSVVAWTGASRRELAGGERATMMATPRAQRLYAEGLEHFRRSEVLPAAERLRAAVEADPGFSGAWLALARSYELLGSDRQAEEAALQALQRSGGLPEPQRLAAEAAYLGITRHLPEAAGRLRRQYELTHRFADGLALAEALVSARQLPEVHAFLSRLRAEHPAERDDARLGLIETGAFDAVEDYANSMAAAERALAAARRQGMAEVEVRVLEARAVGRIRTGTTAACGRAFEDLAAARRKAEAAGNRFLLAGVLQHTGVALSECRQEDTAARDQADQEAIALYREAGAVGRTAVLLYNLGSSRLEEGDLFGADRLMREAFDTCQAYRTQCSERFLHPLGVNRMHRGELAEARRMIEEGLRLNRLQGNRRREAEAQSFLPDLAAWSGDVTQAVELQRQALALRRQIGAPEGIAWAYSDSAFWLAEAGRGTEARVDARRAVALAAEQGNPSLDACSRAGLALADLAAGDLDAADRESAQALARLPPPRTPLASFPVWRVRCQVLLARGKLDAAEALIDQGLQLARRSGFATWELEGRLLRAQLASARGQTAEARRLAGDLAAEARAKGFGLIAERSEAVLGGS